MKVKALHDTCFLEKGKIYDATLDSWDNYNITINGVAHTFQHHGLKNNKKGTKTNEK